MSITKEELQGSWDQMVGSIQKKYCDITGDELAAVKGNLSQLVGLINRKTGQSREEVEHYLSTLTAAGSDTMHRLADSAGRYATNAQEAVQVGYDRLRESSQESYMTARRAVRQSPMESLAMAFGVGVVAGMFVGASMFGRRS
jgi:uncharacterized protein YjbJ (UPF0337 family)